MPRRLQKGWLILAHLALLLSACFAGYLALVSLSGKPIAGCAAGSGCNNVLSTRWAYWLGIPVSLPAFVIYLALLAASWVRTKAQNSTARRCSGQVIVALSLMVLLAAGWFFTVQLLIIKTWCKYCLATHISGCLAAICLLTIFAREASCQTPPETRFHSLTSSALAALIALMVLIVGQVVLRKGFYVVSPLSASSDAARRLSLHHGQFQLSPGDLPFLGAASATNVIVSVFDYTCVHCRELHPILKMAEARFSGRLGIICLPAPLDAECNPSFFLTAPANEHACDYAKLALAVWRARADAFREFDDWLFASDRQPPLSEARAKAEALVGKKALEEALGNRWVVHQIQMNVALYQANGRVIGDARLPQLVIGDAISHGAIERLDDLLLLLEQHLNLKANPADAHLTLSRPGTN